MSEGPGSLHAREIRKVVISQRSVSMTGKKENEAVCMKSAIVAIGTELLFGHTVNTNAAFLSRELNELGIDVVYHYTLGDNPQRLKRIIGMAAEDCDLIIFTGGLGPTEDDLTRETVCEYLNEPLVYDQKAEEQLRRHFNRLNLTFSPNNQKQCYVPAHGVVFHNDAGTAPGFAIRKNSKIYACIPGVPGEMKIMWRNHLKPYLMNFEDAAIVSRRVELFGMGESLVETKLMDLIDSQTDPTLATYAKEGNVEIRITSKRSTAAEASNAVDRMTRLVLDRVGESAYSTEGEKIHDAAARRLLENDITLSCAESPTAGLFAAELVRMPGISRIFDRAYVVYSEKSLTEEMGIEPAFIEKYTPYGPETAEALARSVHEKTRSRMCIAITGLAGPDGYKDMEPGVFHIALLFDGKMTLRTFRHNGWTRHLTRNLMAQTMLDMIIYAIEGRQVPGME